VVEIKAILDEDAVAFDIQVGQGLRPEEWTLLSGFERGVAPVVDWDTTGLSGVWAIQLQTWDAEGRLTRAYSLVSIIN
jgi:hypothetical protein